MFCILTLSRTAGGLHLLFFVLHHGSSDFQKDSSDELVSMSVLGDLQDYICCCLNKRNYVMSFAV